MASIHDVTEHLQVKQSYSPAIDIVAVPSLAEHAIETWRDRKTGVLWLQDLFPARKYNARVLIYDYGVNIKSRRGAEGGMLSHATTLIANLEADRDHEEASQRPIIFICHGYGGLLIKRALAYSQARRTERLHHLRSIFTSTYGILFLGTPHNGFRKEGLALLGRHDWPGPSQLELTLEEGSEMIQDVTDQFTSFMDRFAIHNIWEALETSARTRLDKEKKYSSFVVDETSAAPIWEDVERSGVRKTHSELIKFESRSDPAYRLVHATLKRWIQRAPELIRERWMQDHFDHASDLSPERAFRRASSPYTDRTRAPSPYHFVPDATHGVNEHFLIPRRSSSDFIGRATQAEHVVKCLGPISDGMDPADHKVFVIFGLGGSGKTQFCLKYAEDNHSRYWGVFWIDCSTQETIESGFASLGQLSGKGSTLQAGLYWLASCGRPWLLIMDNADDPDIDWPRYFPVQGNGHILITTRNPDARYHATAGFLQFQGMDPDEAVSLLLKLAHGKSSSEEAPSLADHEGEHAEGIASELGYLALAINFAGITIRQRMITLEKYLKQFLGHRRGMLSLPKVHEKSVNDVNIISTWEIPFQRIVAHPSRGHQDAVDLIRLFAFMHFESVPLAIFQRAFNEFRRTSSVHSSSPAIFLNGATWTEDNEYRLLEAISILREHSIVDYHEEGMACSLHPVVHSWARTRLSEPDHDRWLRCTMAILASCISPQLETSDRSFRRLLLPHIESCLRVAVCSLGILPHSESQATELERFASVYAENGLWTPAKRWQHQVLDFRDLHLGKKNEATVRARRELANTCWNLFDIRQAIDIQAQVLWTHFRWRPALSDWMAWPLWKPQHVPFCLALGDISRSLWLAGELELSKLTGSIAVSGLTEKLGHDDPLVFDAMFNLGRTHVHLHEFDAGHQLLRCVLRRRKRFFGPEHPDTLMVKNEIGVSLCLQNRRLGLAEKLVTEVLRSRQKNMGEEHAYTLWSMNDLSKVMTARGRSEEAVGLLNETVPVAERTLGVNHIGTMMTLGNLVHAYAASKRWENAESILLRLHAACPRESPAIGLIEYRLAQLRVRRDDLKGAEQRLLGLIERLAKPKKEDRWVSRLRKMVPLPALSSSAQLASAAKQLSVIYNVQGKAEDAAWLDQHSVVKPHPGWPVLEAKEVQKALDAQR